MKTTRAVILVAAAILLSASAGLAKDKGGQGPKNPPGTGKSARGQASSAKVGQQASANAEVSVSVHLAFGSDECRVIQAYVDQCRTSGKPGRNVGGLPPGLAKKVATGGQLPPGWQKKCKPGARMDPEIFKLCCPLPRELFVRLPPPPAGFVLVALDGHVFRVHRETLQIHGVFEVKL